MRELLEACYRYWEIGCEKSAVKNACNGRPRYEDVFAYFRRELAEIGVDTCEGFAKLLVRRQKTLLYCVRREESFGQNSTPLLILKKKTK